MFGRTASGTDITIIFNIIHLKCNAVGFDKHFCLLKGAEIDEPITRIIVKL
jgi:hypothetical protein